MARFSALWMAGVCRVVLLLALMGAMPFSTPLAHAQTDQCEVGITCSGPANLYWEEGTQKFPYSQDGLTALGQQFCSSSGCTVAWAPVTIPPGYGCSGDICSGGYSQPAAAPSSLLRYNLVTWVVQDNGVGTTPRYTYVSTTTTINAGGWCAGGAGVPYDLQSDGQGHLMCDAFSPVGLGPGNQDATRQGCPWGCNPVLLATGDKNDVEEDFRNASPYPITIDRTYSSATGYWRFNFQRSLVFSSNTATSKVSALLYRPDGSRITYTAPLALGTTTSYAWAPASGPSQTAISTLTDTKDSNGHVTGFDLKNLNDEDEHYDATGRFVSLTDRSGNALTYSYDGQGRVAGIADSAGRSVTLTYPTGTWPYATATAIQLSQLPLSVSDGTQTVGYTYADGTGTAAAGQLLTVTHPDSTVLTYGYSGSNLTSITDENHQVYATYQYNGHQVTQSVHGNNQETINYGYGTQATTVTDGTGHSATLSTGDPTVGQLGMTGANAPCTACFGLGAYGASASYDAFGNQTSLTDFNGNQTTSVYDTTRGLPTSVTEAVGSDDERTTTIVWNPTFRLPASLTQKVDVNGNTGTRVTAFTYDGFGNALTKTVTATPAGGGTPVARTWTYTYNTAGQTLTAKPPRTDVDGTVHYSYDGSGNLTSITDALGHVTTLSHYTPEGLVGQVTDPNGLVTTLTYDPRQRLTQVARGSSGTHQETWQLAYAPTGLLSKVTRPDGSAVTYGYDQAHRLTEIDEVDENGNVDGKKVYTLDASGQVTQTQVYDDNGDLAQTGTATYDANNRLQHAVGALTAQTTGYVHDTQGDLTQVTDANGHVTTAGYDGLNRLTRVTDALSGVANTAYDPSDEVIGVRDKNHHATTYAYDGFGGVTQTVSPDTGTTTRTYDADGNLSTATDARGSVASFTYDAMDRPTQATFAHGGTVTQTQTFTYDSCTNGIGRLCGFSDASGSTAYTYDLWGRVTSKAQTLGSGSGAPTLTVTYAYDTTGHMVTQTYPSGQAVHFTYLNNRPFSITVGSTPLIQRSFFEPFGGDVGGWEWGDGSFVGFTYDQNLWINEIDDVDSKVYALDNAGNITGITDGANPSTDQTYGYDPVNRLTSDVVSGLPASVTYGYSYDSNANRTALTQTGAFSTAFTIDPSSNRVTQTQVGTGVPVSVVTDAAGNITSDGSNTYTFDDQGRLATSTNGSNLVTTYTYNALGQRIRKANTNGTTYFAYDENGLLIGTYDGTTGNSTDELVYLEDRPVATLRGSTTYRILTDHLKTPRKLIDASNATVWSWDGKEAFGNTAPIGSLTFNLRFPGQYADVETGLFNNGFRDYDPAWGRYVESDPIGLNGGLNTYGYVEGTPANFTDHSGEDIYVAYFNGTPGGNSGGHIGVNVATPRTIGWYPESVFGLVAGPGTLSDDISSEFPKDMVQSGAAQPNILIKIPTTSQQDAAAQAYINKYLLGSYYYSLPFRDCSIFVGNVLNSAGLDVPRTAIPYVLAVYLNNKYGHTSINANGFPLNYKYSFSLQYGNFINNVQDFLVGRWRRIP